MPTIPDIANAIETLITQELGAPWSPLDFMCDLTENTSGTARTDRKFSVSPLKSEDSSELTGQIVLNQFFQVVLTRNYIEPSSDDLDKRVQTRVLVEEGQIIYRSLRADALNIPEIILITDLEILEPEFAIIELNGSNRDFVTVLRMNFNVKIRQQL